MTKGEPRPPRGPSKLPEEHSMTVKIPLKDYRTLQAYAAERFTKPTTLLKKMIHDLCEGERNLATHKK